MARVTADANGRPAPAPRGTGLTAVSATAPLVLQLSGTVLSGAVDEMTGATAGTPGLAGTVPPPAAGDQGKYLKGDGTWGAPAGGGGGGLSGLTAEQVPVADSATTVVDSPITVKAATGRVGLGVTAPTDALHIQRSNERAAVFLEGLGDANGYGAVKMNSTHAASEFLVAVGYGGAAGLQIRDTNAGANRLTIDNATGVVDAPAGLAVGGVAASLVGHAHPGVYQPADAELTAIAGLTSAADRLPYFTGSGAAALATFPAFGRTLAASADAAAARTSLALVPGTNVQAYDAELTAIAGLTSAADRLPYFTGLGTAALAVLTAFGRSLVAAVDAAAARVVLGLGALATKATVATADIDAGAVTYTKIQNVSAASKLLGRGSAAGAGSPEEITVGSGLTMTGTTLSATAGSMGGSGTTGTLPKFTASTTLGDSNITISGSAVGINEPTPGAQFHLSETGGSLALMLLDGYGVAANVVCRTALGSKASPTAVTTGTTLGGYGIRGYGATQFSSGARVYLLGYAAENWTDAAQGAYWVFGTTAIGTNAVSERLRITDNGRLTLNSGPQIITGTGAPESVVTAVVGSIYLRTDGGASTTLYVKQTGTGNTGWAAK